MRKVIYIIAALGVGGAETVVKDYTCKLDKNKYNILVLVVGSKMNTIVEKSIENSGCRIMYLGLNSKKNETLQQKIIRQIRRYIRINSILIKEKPDILHTHLQVNRFVAFYLFTHWKCKFFYTAHSEIKRLFFGDSERKHERYITRCLAMRKNTIFIALHKDMKIDLSKLFYTKRVITIGNGIDFDKFLKTPFRKNEARIMLDIPQDTFVIGHVGRFSKEKNHDFIFNLFKYIESKNNNVFLLLVGDGERKSIFIDKMNKSNLASKYMILSNRSDVNFLLKAMDVFLFPSKSEGLGLALIEAQLANINCVISSNIPNSSIISNHVISVSLDDSYQTWYNAIFHNYTDKMKFNSCAKQYQIENSIRLLEMAYDGKERDI